MNILFVCTGNTCRSAMCEAYFNHLCRASGIPRLHAESAGISAADGMRASEFAQKAVSGYDTDIASHRSRHLTREIVRSADLVVVMTAAHRERVLALDSESVLRTRLLSEFRSGPSVRGIADPYGGDLQVYTRCFEDMKEPLECLFELFSKTNNI